MRKEKLMKTKLITVLLMTCLSLPFTASAAVPVIDLSAIAQLVNQVIEMQKAVSADGQAI
jgi:hypothetical protein